MKLHTIKRNPACNGRTISVRPGVGSSERARVVSGWTGAVPLAVAGLVRFVCAGDPVPIENQSHGALQQQSDAGE